MKERSFLQRNERVVLWELSDVVALDRRGSAQAPAPGRRPDLTALGVRAADVRAFEDAGWIFRERDPGAPRRGDVGAKVFLRAAGNRIVLGTNRLTIQFQDDLSEQQAKTALRPFGCLVWQRLTFAPGLYEVELTPQARGDAIDVANELSASGLVKFAEPQLVEVIVPRPG